ncbi:MAG: ISL3 family transposase, partial [FCB group bacterium]|nr:ISL3 family transposase [FCB group bacterium]
LPFMKGTARCTRSFALTVPDLLRFGTIRSVAGYLHVGRDMVRNIHKAKLTTVYREIDLKKVRYLGVDEFSIRKGHTYMTVFIDLQTGRVLHAAEGTRREDIAPFLKTLSKKSHNIRAVSVDMSGSFSSSFKEYLPDIPVVFDRYHIMARINRKIDSLRREQFNRPDTAGKDILKVSRFLLLRNFHSLTGRKKCRPEKLLKVNRPLFIMHTMKEQLRLFRRQRGGEAAAAFLKQWCFDALMSDIKQLVSTGAMILRHRNGLLNYYPHRISNGPSEGLNNKIKTIKRQAYGFRDMEYFKLRLYDMHASKYSFAG